MFTAIRKRLDARNEKGFTLIELLVVIIIIGILLAIAVPSYLGFRTRASDASAKANLRAAIPAAETHFADFGTYIAPNALTPAALAVVDAGVSPTVTVPAGVWLTATAYCLQETVGGRTWSVKRPTPGTFVNGVCA